MTGCFIEIQQTPTGCVVDPGSRSSSHTRSTSGADVLLLPLLAGWLFDRSNRRSRRSVMMQGWPHRHWQPGFHTKITAGAGSGSRTGAGSGAGTDPDSGLEPEPDPDPELEQTRTRDWNRSRTGLEVRTVKTMGALKDSQLMASISRDASPTGGTEPLGPDQPSPHLCEETRRDHQRKGQEVREAAVHRSSKQKGVVAAAGCCSCETACPANV